MPPSDRGSRYVPGSRRRRQSARPQDESHDSSISTTVATPPPALAVEPVLTDKRRYLPGLDGWRALACLSVFAANFHRMAEMRGQFGPFDVERFLESGVGVALLFVMSGYLLTLSFWGRERPAAPDIVSYAAKRIARILPAYLLCLTAVVLATKHWNSASELKDTLLHFTLLHNFSNRTFYSINQPFWTIGIQAQFYIILPLVLTLAAMLCSTRRQAFIIVTLACAGSFALHYALVERFAFGSEDYVWTKSVLAHLPIFMLGVMGAYIHTNIARNEQPSPSRQSLADAVFWMGLVAVLVILTTKLEQDMTVPHGRYNFPYVPVLLTAILVATPYASAAKLLEWSVLRSLGAISFGIYLFHLPCLKLVARFMGEAGLDKQTHWPVLGMAGLGLTVAAAYASYIFVEQPLLKMAKNKD